MCLEINKMLKYSLKELAAKIDFDLEDFIPLIELFLDTTDLNLNAINAAAKGADNEIISFNIHNIKGASLNLGLEKISVITEQMSLLNNKGSFADIEKRVEECKVELIELRSLLEKN